MKKGKNNISTILRFDCIRIENIRDSFGSSKMFFNELSHRLLLQNEKQSVK